MMKPSIVPMQIFLFSIYRADSVVRIALCALLCIPFYTLLCGFLYSLSCFLSYTPLCKFYYVDFIMQILLCTLLAGFYHENLLCKINCVDYNCRILSNFIAIFCHTDSVVKSFVPLCGFHCTDFIVQILPSRHCYVSHCADFPI